MNRLESEPLDLRQYLRLFRRRGWIFVLCVVLIPVGAYLYTDRLPEVYQSASVLQIQSSPAESSLLPGESFIPQQNIQAVASFVSTSVVADAAARVLDEPEGTLLGAASASADEITGFITITAEGSTAERAQNIADAFAEALGATRERRARRRIDSAVKGIQRDLGNLGPEEAVTRQQLETELRRLRTLESAQAQNAQVLEPALPGVKIAPNPRRNATVALILALLLGIGLMLFAERADRRIRRPEELEAITRLPLLGTIPKPAFPGGHPSPQTVEAFQTLRDSVTYFNVDEELKSFVVVSALKGEGKTTVATHLAVAYARAGKRVIIVDADLRKPEVAERIGVDTPVGLSQVLAGGKLSEALREVPQFGSRLRVLGGGPVPPNPSELLGSKRMESLLTTLCKHADVVIFDTPPLLLVSDAFPLLDKVSGVLALARLDQATREPLRRMLEVASTAGGRMLGMIATGAHSREQYGYGYGYGDGYGPEKPVDEAARFESRLGQVPPKQPAAAEERPAAEEQQPAAEQEQPAAEQEQPAAEQEQPAAEQEQPAPALDEREHGDETRVTPVITADPVLVGEAAPPSPAQNGFVPRATPPPVPGTAEKPVAAGVSGDAEEAPQRRRRLFRRK